MTQPKRKLTPSLKAMLERIARASDGKMGGIMLLSLLGSGGSAKTVFRRLQEEGWIEQFPMLLREPTPAARITDAGRAALEAK